MEPINLFAFVSDTQIQRPWLNFREASKLLNIPNLGRNNLLKILRQLKVLDHNNCYEQYYQRLSHMFKVTGMRNTPLITYEGLEYLKKEFPDNF